ncbi:DUF4410 domain-containing protein [Hydrogenophaga palleronii]|uniref:DUF4410 domain-containing protein n=1 Tax=Hydrogenophaga palleronii TaxID=65655 RepID=UPI0014726611|nr:DUF4410 domain-containing protein [Hydrogenophaga palleronii]
MNRHFSLLVLATAFALGGCAASVNRASAPDTPPLRAAAVPTTQVALFITGKPTATHSANWHTFSAEWRTAFQSAASNAGLGFAYFETEPASQPAGTTLVKISVNDYRYLTSGARYGFGVMTGNAFIEADAFFIEMPSKRLLGTRQYTTSSSAWQGIFSAMTDKQVAALSNEIIQDIQRK